MAQDRPRVFDGGANVEVLTCRVVRRYEVEAAVVFVVKAGRVHETAGTRGLERLRQLANQKWTDMRWDRHQPAAFEKVDHFSLPAFILLEKVLLVCRDAFAARRVWIGKRRIGEQRFQRA